MDHVFLISSVQEGHLPPRSKYFPEFLPVSVGFTAVRLVQANNARKGGARTATATAPPTSVGAFMASGFPFTDASGPGLVREEDQSSSGSITPTHLQGDQMGVPLSDAAAWDADFFAWREAAGDRTSSKRRKTAKTVSGGRDRLSDDSESPTDDEYDGSSPVLGRVTPSGKTTRDGEDDGVNPQAAIDEVVKGRTTVVFKVKSPVDVCFTPLAVESLQRLVISPFFPSTSDKILP
jgi:hypothetical protein